MCSRFALIKKLTLLQEDLEFENPDDESEENKENLPTDNIYSIHYNEKIKRKTVTRKRWGLLPNFIKDFEQIKKYSLFNARSESLEEKPAFRNLLDTNRCLIPADVFYEFKQEGKTKDKYAFALNSNSIFLMAGLWDRWINPKTNQETLSCTILTTNANEIVKPIHEKDRMPVILEKEFYENWLDPNIKFSDLKFLLKPFPSQKMKLEKLNKKDNTDLPQKSSKSSHFRRDSEPLLFGS